MWKEAIIICLSTWKEAIVICLSTWKEAIVICLSTWKEAIVICLSILILAHNFPGGTEENAKIQVMSAGQRAEIEALTFRVQRRNAKQSLATFLPVV
jgi:hypothetical protein